MSDNYKYCPWCDHVNQVEEWDSDRILYWECELSGLRVEPDFTCQYFKREDCLNELDDVF
jgi:hypothetical protein